jgi:hypothetical protein
VQKQQTCTVGCTPAELNKDQEAQGILLKLLQNAPFAVRSIIQRSFERHPKIILHHRIQPAFSKKNLVAKLL